MSFLFLVVILVLFIKYSTPKRNLEKEVSSQSVFLALFFTLWGCFSATLELENHRDALAQHFLPRAPVERDQEFRAQIVLT